MGATTRKTLTFYTKPDCGLCQQAERVLDQAALRIEFERITIDITQNAEAHQRFSSDIPVVEIEGVVHARHHINEKDLLSALTT